MRTLFLIIVLATIGFVTYLFIFTTDQAWQNLSLSSPTEKAIERKVLKDAHAEKNLHFDLIDPNQAPPQIKELVKQGFQYMLHTHELLPQYAENIINCSNCHFNGGITTGGSGNGISLAAAAAQYPKFDSAVGKVVDLPERINLCFKNSLNGKPLPLDSREMLALITYLHWISTGYPIYAPAPWLGQKTLKSSHIGNLDQGRKNYQIYCANCHGEHGEGSNEGPDHPGVGIPSLWGSYSFNSKAGMNKPETLASFIYYNMPYEEPHLSAEQAIDIATFITQQKRP